MRYLLIHYEYNSDTSQYRESFNIYLNLMSNVCVSGTILKNGFSTPSYFHVYFILLQSYLSLTLCDRSYPLLNTEMDTFMKYYFTTFMKNLFALASILYPLCCKLHYPLLFRPLLWKTRC